MDRAFLERLRLALSYDAATGDLRWRITKGRCIAGAVAGTIAANGYRYIDFERRRYLSHRIAWMMHFGTNPPQNVDHADRNKLNNAIANLRAATKFLNAGNTGVIRSNSSGYRGVSWDKERGRWAAYIWRSGRKYHLGYFGERETAARAYDRAAAAQFGDFAFINVPAAA